MVKNNETKNGVTHNKEIHKKKLLGTLDLSINSTTIERTKIPPDIEPKIKHINKPKYSS